MTDRPTKISGPEIFTADPQTTAVIAAEVPIAELKDFFDAAFHAVADVLLRQGVAPQAAFGYYPKMPTETIALEGGFITNSPITREGKVLPGELPGGQIARATYVGSYEGLEAAYGEFAEWIHAQGREPGPAMWEVYVTEPTPDVDPGSMRTDLFWPLV